MTPVKVVIGFTFFLAAWLLLSESDGRLKSCTSKTWINSCNYNVSHFD
jgi:hypothetical protein